MDTTYSFESFVDDIHAYIYDQKVAEEKDIKTVAEMDDDKKEEEGFLIRNAIVIKKNRHEWELKTPVNNTKLRISDKVKIKIQGKKYFLEAIVLDNKYTTITILYLEDGLNVGDICDIEVSQVVMLETLEKLSLTIVDGAPGSSFIRELAGFQEPHSEGLGSLPERMATKLPATMNKEQRDFAIMMMKRPSIHCLQGPPGTGKTLVLAAIAKVFSLCGKEVLIISNTHQAVNNALNKTSQLDSSLPIYKIGSELQSVELKDSIHNIANFNEYKEVRKLSRKKRIMAGDIVGMTFHAAVIHLGLRHAAFNPFICLVDEAGQMPMAFGSLIGCFGVGSIIFFGDDLQMPPIFHPSLIDHPFSTSIFSFIAKKYPNLRTTLTTTYRMNSEITKCVSDSFYKIHGIELVASDLSKDRTISLTTQCKDEQMKRILESKDGIIRMNVTKQDIYEDQNPEEASFIGKLIGEALKAGLKSNQIAVITPYRRQVNAIRESISNEGVKDIDIPLVDTVERLQGQDVDMIIISLCTSSESYYRQNDMFILNKNRMNVMISRAKEKVVIFAPSMIALTTIDYFKNQQNK